jgi:hypothetical protein
VGIGGPDMPVTKRITRYRSNVMAIREAGHAVPSPVADTLDATQIEAWIRRRDEAAARLADAMLRIARLPDDTTFPSPFG